MRIPRVKSPRKDSNRGEAAMRKWWAKLACIAGLAVMGTTPEIAHAQFGCGACCGGGRGQPCSSGDPWAATSLPEDGVPNAFADCPTPCTWKEECIWAGLDYLVGITRRSPLGVPLVTSSTNPNNVTGILGQPDTVVLFGLQGLDLQTPQGYRATIGISPTRDWLVPFEVVYTYLHQRTNAFSQESDSAGTTLLARPIVSVQEGTSVGTQPGVGVQQSSGVESSVLVSGASTLAGGVNVDASLQYWGLQGTFVIRTCCQWGDDCCGCAFDLPLGVRYLNLHEVLNITSNSTALTAESPAFFLGRGLGVGDKTIVTDIFRGNNEFLGAEFGLRFEGRADGLRLMLEPRISIGATQQSAIIDGYSALLPAGGGTPETTAGGLLAVGSNSGRFFRNQFTYLPETTATLSWQCFPCMRIQAGYNLTYWPNVQRPGTEISRTVNLSQVPTSASFNPTATATSPSFVFKDSNFLIQDLSLGVVFSF
jgi:hypothetical protein